MANLQAIGGNFKFSWKKEIVDGVPNFPLVGGGLNSTLAQDAKPGDTQIVVVSDTGAAAGDKIRIGADDNPQYLLIDSGYAGGTTIDIDPKTPILFRAAAGDAVQEVTIAGFKSLPGFVSTDEIGNIAKILSQARSGTRGRGKSRPGSVDVSFNMNFEVGVEHIGEFLVYHLGEDYSAEGTVKAGGLSTTLSSAASKGDTTLPLTALTNANPGDEVQVNTGDGAEVVKIDSGWNGTDNPVPLDSTTPLRKAHASGAAVVEVEAPFTVKAKRGLSVAAMTQVLYATDIDLVMLVKGAKIDSLSMNLVNDDNTIVIQAAIVAQSAQLLETNIFGSPAVLSHDFYVPYEVKMKKDGAVFADAESPSFTSTNDIDTGGRNMGSRFRRRVRVGRGGATGSFDYSFTDASMLKDLVKGTLMKLEADFVYELDNLHGLNFEFPAASLSGGMFPSVADDGPISDTKSFEAEYKEADKSDIIVTIKSNQYLLAA